MDIYAQNGHTSREAYLKSLALEHHIDQSSVFALADLLGKSEDFDGLVEELKDFSQFI